MNTNLSKVEASFFNTSDIELQKTKIPYIKVSNYPDLYDYNAKPAFATKNLPSLIAKLKEWEILK